MKRVSRIVSSGLVVLLGLALASSARAQQRDPGSSRGAELEGVGKEAALTGRTAWVASHFRGSIFIFDQSITPETMSAQAQLSQIPSYQWWMSLRPRYYIKPYLSLRVRLDLTLEWLNGGPSETTLVRQPILGDLWTDLAYTPPRFFGIDSTVSARFIFPTSLASQSATTVMKVGPSVNFSRTFATKIGDFEPSLGFYALYNFVMNTSGATRSPYACTSTEYTPTFCSQNTGLMDSQAQFIASVSGRYSPHPRVGINLSYLIIDSWAYPTPDATVVDTTGGSTVVPHSTEDTRFRQSSWFLASVDYDPIDWLGLSLGYYTVRPTRDPDGSIGNPFWKPDGGSRVFLTTTFNLDRIYIAAARRYKASRAKPVAVIPTTTRF